MKNAAPECIKFSAMQRYAYVKDFIKLLLVILVAAIKFSHRKRCLVCCVAKLF